MIGLQQIPNALGVDKPEGEKVLLVAWRALVEFVAFPNWTAIGLSLSVAAVMLTGARWKPTIPFSIVAVIAATVIAQVFHLDAAAPIGDLPSGLPAPSSPSWTLRRSVHCWPRRSPWPPWPRWNLCFRRPWRTG